MNEHVGVNTNTNENNFQQHVSSLPAKRLARRASDN